MRRHFHIPEPVGFSLVELLIVVAVLALCLVAGSICLAHGLRAQEARGAAQSWQAAASWAQTGVLWHSGRMHAAYSHGSLGLRHDSGLCGGDLGPSAPSTPVRTNLSRWRCSDGVVVSFTGALASPDGGGSLYFDAVAGSYRVVVRPESGLTTRFRIEAQP